MLVHQRVFQKKTWELCIGIYFKDSFQTDKTNINKTHESMQLDLWVPASQRGSPTIKEKKVCFPYVKKVC